MKENPYEGTDDDDEVALTGVSNVYFPEMKIWLQEYLMDVAKRVMTIYTPPLCGWGSGVRGHCGWGSEVIVLYQLLIGCGC